MQNPNTKGISVHVDRELHAEITGYLQENNIKKGDFIALAAQNELHPNIPGIGSKLQSWARVDPRCPRSLYPDRRGQ